MNRPLFFPAILLLACLQSGPVFANEYGVYESLEHIRIGRVFLSPAEREDLDKNRGVRAPVAASGDSTSRVTTAKNNNAAGYIVSSNGRARIWKDGDFVAAIIPDSLRFPGDVKVTRTADQVPKENGTTAVGDKLPAEGVADDAN